MKRSQGKLSIIIYPIRHSNTLPKSLRAEIDTASGTGSGSGSGLPDSLSSYDANDIFRPKHAKIGEKRDYFPANISKLSSIKQCQSLSPRLRKDWLDGFIDTINLWNNDNKQVKALEKGQFQLKSSIAQVLKSVNIHRKPSKSKIF